MECARDCYSTRCKPALCLRKAASFTQAALSIREQTNPPRAPALVSWVAWRSPRLVLTEAALTFSS